VPAASATASILRTRVRRLLDPGRDRSARFSRATSLVSVMGLALALVGSTRVRPVVTFHEWVPAVVTGPVAAIVPAEAERRAPEPAFHANLDSPPGARARVPRRTIDALKPPSLSEPLPERAPHGMASTSSDEPLTTPLDSAALAADTHALTLGTVVPSPQATAPSSTVDDPAPWEALATSTTSAADDMGRAATAAGARAQSAGIAIGRFVTRVSKAGTSIF
jgi:hypothetical protein